MTDRLLNWMIENLSPEGGFVTSAGSFGAGWVIGRINPEVITDTLFIAQLSAFFVSILVGVATLYTLHLRWRKGK